MKKDVCNTSLYQALEVIKPLLKNYDTATVGSLLSTVSITGIVKLLLSEVTISSTNINLVETEAVSLIFGFSFIFLKIKFSENQTAW